MNVDTLVGRVGELCRDIEVVVEVEVAIRVGLA
jgi:hypothetical protein